MAKVNKTILKSYFESGDVPNQSQYVDLIDSQFNLADTETQIIDGTLSSSAAIIGYLNLKKAYLPGIGIADAKVGSTFVVGRSLEVSGSIVSNTGSFGHLITTGDISSSKGLIIGNITASGNISSSGTSTFQDIILGYNGNIYGKDSSGNTNDVIVTNIADTSMILGDTDSLVIVQGESVKLWGPVTASHNISASITTGVHRFGTTISSSGGFTGSHVWGTDYVSSSQMIGAPRITASMGGVYAVGQIYASSNITASNMSASGDLMGKTISSSNNLLVSKSIYYGSGSDSFQMSHFNTTLNSFVFGNTDHNQYYRTKTLGTHWFLDGNVVVGVTNNYNTSKLDVDGQLSADHITSSGAISASGTITGDSLIIDGSSVKFRNLPGTDPGEAGRIWSDGGKLKISSG